MLTPRRLNAATWCAMLFVAVSYVAAQRIPRKLGCIPSDAGWPADIRREPLMAPKIALGPQNGSFTQWIYSGIATNAAVGVVLLLATAATVERIIRRSAGRRVGLTSFLHCVAACICIAALLRSHPEWLWPDFTSDYLLGLSAEPPTFADYLASEPQAPMYSLPGVFVGVGCLISLLLTSVVDGLSFLCRRIRQSWTLGLSRT